MESRKVIIGLFVRGSGVNINVARQPTSPGIGQRLSPAGSGLMAFSSTIQFFLKQDVLATRSANVLTCRKTYTRSALPASGLCVSLTTREILRFALQLLGSQHDSAFAIGTSAQRVTLPDRVKDHRAGSIRLVR